MSGKSDGGRDPEAPGDEEASGGHLQMDAELEAALREAAEAVEEAGAEVEEAEALGEGDGGGAGEKLGEELAENRDRLLRLQADFDNFRKRALKERQEAVQYGHQNLFKDLLSVVDNLDRAIGHAQDSGGGDLDSFLQGVDLVRRELLGVFQKHHVTEIEALGKPFDPALHEAMAQVESDAVPAGNVVDVLQKGFQLRDRLVRPARVVVAKAPEGSDQTGGGTGG